MQAADDSLSPLDVSPSIPRVPCATDAWFQEERLPVCQARKGRLFPWSGHNRKTVGWTARRRPGRLTEAGNVEKIYVRGGNPLSGAIRVGGSKNASLGLMAA